MPYTLMYLDWDYITHSVRGAGACGGALPGADGADRTRTWHRAGRGPAQPGEPGHPAAQQAVAPPPTEIELNPPLL